MGYRISLFQTVSYMEAIQYRKKAIGILTALALIITAQLPVCAAPLETIGAGPFSNDSIAFSPDKYNKSADPDSEEGYYGLESKEAGGYEDISDDSASGGLFGAEPQLLSGNESDAANNTAIEEPLSLSGNGSDAAETAFIEEVFLEADQTALPSASHEPVISENSVSVCSLSADFSGRTAFLTKKKAVLNAALLKDSDELYMVFNVSGNYAIEGITNGGGISISYNQTLYRGLPAIRLTLSSNSAAMKGTKSYTLTPKDLFSGERLKPLKLTLSVQKKYPPAKWQRTNIVLQQSVKGDFALNSPAQKGVTIVNLSSERYPAKIPDGLKVRLDNENTVRISKLNKNYKVQLYLAYSGYANVKFVKKSFNVKLISGKLSAALKKKAGSKINLSDRAGTQWHLVPNVKNTGLVLRKIELQGSLSKNYALRTVSDPDSEALTDIYISAISSANPPLGTSPLSLKLILQGARQDAKTITQNVNAKIRHSASTLKIKTVQGKKLIFSKKLSDNKLVCYIDCIVTAPAYGGLDPESIEDISDPAKTPKGAFFTRWDVDSTGKAARATLVMDKSRLSSGKTYKITYRMRAKGAPEKRSSKLIFTVKAP